MTDPAPDTSLISRVRRSITFRTVHAARRLNSVTPRWPVPRLEAPVVVCCVYRTKNAHHVKRMLSQLPQGADVRLHALEVATDELAAITLARGPGKRMPLLRSLIEAAPVPPDAWVMIVDDDADFARNGRSPFLDIAAAAGFDIAGAAIGVGQHHAFHHTRVAAVSVCRTVSMVEVGPVVALSPRAQRAVLPFPEDSGMGWGLDVRWAGLDGLRLGYVDATPIRHHGLIAVSYAKDEELRRLHDELAAAGAGSLRELTHTLETWRAWQRQPPWSAP